MKSAGLFSFMPKSLTPSLDITSNDNPVFIEYSTMDLLHLIGHKEPEEGNKKFGHRKGDDETIDCSCVLDR